jgi:hypothetical protein
MNHKRLMAKRTKANAKRKNKTYTPYQPKLIPQRKPVDAPLIADTETITL